MDGTRFDTLTKAWSRPSRRRVLGGLAMGVVSVLPGHGVPDGSAQVLSCKRSRNCGDGQRCVHKTCTSKCNDPYTCKSGEGNGCTAGCFCAKTPGGAAVCVQQSETCDTEVGCRNQRDCGTGRICVTGCCAPGTPEFFCALPCVV